MTYPRGKILKLNLKIAIKFIPPVCAGSSFLAIHVYSLQDLIDVPFEYFLS